MFAMALEAEGPRAFSCNHFVRVAVWRESAPPRGSKWLEGDELAMQVAGEVVAPVTGTLLFLARSDALISNLHVIRTTDSAARSS